MYLYITCDTGSSDTNYQGRSSVLCYLKHVGITTKIRGGEQFAKRGGVEGGSVVIFIVCVLWLGSGPCLNIVM